MSRPRPPDGADGPIARDRARLLAARHALSRRLFRKARRIIRSIEVGSIDLSALDPLPGCNAS